MVSHLVFDMLSLAAAWYVTRHIRMPSVVSGERRWYYFTVVTIGFAFGAWFFGTLNNTLTSHTLHPGKSLIGALAGAIVAAELFKKATGVIGSTGARYVISLSVAIAVGRIGCFSAGLEDFTYGTPTLLPWGVDMGDGVTRHPVALYEAAVMIFFAWYAYREYRYRFERFKANIFYRFILVYALQRFVWEFFKPYATFALGLNVYQWLALVLTLYASYMLKRSEYGFLSSRL
jgi:prolipoprotein diacylglyceryltransferase